MSTYVYVCRPSSSWELEGWSLRTLRNLATTSTFGGLGRSGPRRRLLCCGEALEISSWQPLLRKWCEWMKRFIVVILLSLSLLPSLLLLLPFVLLAFFSQLCIYECIFIAPKQNQPAAKRTLLTQARLEMRQTEMSEALWHEFEDAVRFGIHLIRRVVLRKREDSLKKAKAKAKAKAKQKQNRTKQNKTKQKKAGKGEGLNSIDQYEFVEIPATIAARKFICSSFARSDEPKPYNASINQSINGFQIVQRASLNL